MAAEVAVAQAGENVAAVAAAVENAGEHIAEVAAQHSEAAIETVVQQIEADLERENTWLGGQLTALKIQMEELKGMISPLSSAIAEKLAALQTMVESHLSTPAPSADRPAVETPSGESGAAPEVPPAVTPPEAPEASRRQKKYRKI